ncbi:hypothetical protein [Desulfosporosinus lacus]|uniref:hypothetical protein n=1 Tax=Desulfosporosinus lacus TaxID=329936 RepID=UPI0011610F0F|nr:hypothetical protein [Desulfosporosinus lacus]
MTQESIIFGAAFADDDNTGAEHSLKRTDRRSKTSFIFTHGGPVDNKILHMGVVAHIPYHKLQQRKLARHLFGDYPDFVLYKVQKVYPILSS